MAEDATALQTRRRLYDVVVAAPGISAREIQRAGGTAWGDTTYHLLRLEEAGHVHRERGAQQDFYFARAVPVAAGPVLRLSRSPSVRRVLIALLEEPGLDLDALAARSTLTPGRLTMLLRRMVVLGLVTEGRREAVATYAVGDRRAIGQLMVQYRHGPIDAAVERLIATWAELFPS